MIIIKTNIKHRVLIKICILVPTIFGCGRLKLKTANSDMYTSRILQNISNMFNTCSCSRAAFESFFFELNTILWKRWELLKSYFIKTILTSNLVKIADIIIINRIFSVVFSLLPSSYQRAYKNIALSAIYFWKYLRIIQQTNQKLLCLTSDYVRFALIKLLWIFLYLKYLSMCLKVYLLW